MNKQVIERFDIWFGSEGRATGETTGRQIAKSGIWWRDEDVRKLQEQYENELRDKEALIVELMNHQQKTIKRLEKQGEQLTRIMKLVEDRFK